MLHDIYQHDRGARFLRTPTTILRDFGRVGYHDLKIPIGESRLYLSILLDGSFRKYRGHSYSPSEAGSQ